MLALCAVLGLFSSARAGLVYNGSVGGISLGVTGYGGGAQVNPVWIANNFTGLNDILASPGGTFQLANPIIANNTTSTGPVAIAPGQSIVAAQVGGGNVNGPFGAAAAAIYGPYASFAITDSAPGGGSASYGIESWVSNYTQVGNFVGTFGTVLSIGGAVTAPGSAAVAALQTEVAFTLGGVTTNYVLDPLILAIGNLGGGNYTFVAKGGPTGLSAGMLVNGPTGAFTGLAFDNYAAVIANGTDIQVTSTLTFYADPASIDSIAPDLSLFPGLGPLPTLDFGGVRSVPEPGSIALVLVGGALAVGTRIRRRRAAA